MIIYPYYTGSRMEMQGPEAQSNLYKGHFLAEMARCCRKGPSGGSEGASARLQRTDAGGQPAPVPAPFLACRPAPSIMGPGFRRRLKGTFVEIRKGGGGRAERAQRQGRGCAPALPLVWRPFGPPNAAAPQCPRPQRPSSGASAIFRRTRCRALSTLLREQERASAICWYRRPERKSSTTCFSKGESRSCRRDCI